MQRPHIQSGYMTLVSVVTVGAIGVAITITLLLLGASSSQSALVFEQEAQANQLAHGCAEEVLKTIKDAPSYTGTTLIDPFGQGSCSYAVTDTGGSTRQIDSIGSVDSVTQRVQVLISNTSPVNVTSWLEVVSF